MITVEFVQVVSGNGYDIRITPETVVVRCGDTLEWSVQGLPPGLAKKVGVGNFRRLDPPWRVTHGGRGFGVPRAKAINTKRIKSRFALNRATVTFELGNLEPGNYKRRPLGRRPDRRRPRARD